MFCSFPRLQLPRERTPPSPFRLLLPLPAPATSPPPPPPPGKAFLRWNRRSRCSPVPSSSAANVLPAGDLLNSILIDLFVGDSPFLLTGTSGAAPLLCRAPPQPTSRLPEIRNLRCRCSPVPSCLRSHRLACSHGSCTMQSPIRCSGIAALMAHAPCNLAGIDKTTYHACNCSLDLPDHNSDDVCLNRLSISGIGAAAHNRTELRENSNLRTI